MASINTELHQRHALHEQLLQLERGVAQMQINLELDLYRRIGLPMCGDITTWREAFLGQQSTKHAEESAYILRDLRRLAGKFRSAEDTQALVHKLDEATALSDEMEEIVDQLHAAWNRVQGCVDQATRDHMTNELATMGSSIVRFAHRRDSLAGQYNEVQRLVRILQMPEDQFEAFLSPLKTALGEDVGVESERICANISRLRVERYEVSQRALEVSTKASTVWNRFRTSDEERRELLSDMHSLHALLFGHFAAQAALQDDLSCLEADLKKLWTSLVTEDGVAVNVVELLLFEITSHGVHASVEKLVADQTECKLILTGVLKNQQHIAMLFEQIQDLSAVVEAL